MEKTYAGMQLEVNDEGYLISPDQWTRDIGSEIAKEEEIDMTDDHWKVIDYLREQHANQVPLTIRKVGKSGVIDIKGFYQLFPKGPLKVSTRIAGIPKPVSCI
jgi:tRNA 2-thiouridine synthesizing protein E